MVTRGRTTKPMEGPSNQEDSILFARFREGDDRSFLELFRRHNGRILLYCLKIVGDHPAAEDLTQEMWERVIGLRHETVEVRNPVGLFVRIARNLCIDHLRRKGRVIATPDIDEMATPMYATSAPTELEETALAALERLPYDYREVLVLNLYCGYRYDEIAVMLGKSPDAIWARASRARTQLRRMVAAAMPPSERTTSDSPAASGTSEGDRPKHGRSRHDTR